MLAGADDVAIRQEAAIVDRIDLARDSFLEKTVLVELMVKMLGDLVVLRGVRPAERIEGKSEPFSKLLLQSMHLRAVIRDRQSGFVRGQFGRGAVLVRRANEQDFVPAGPLETGVGVGRKHRADQIAEMLYTVDVRQRGGDQVTGHCS